MDSGAQPPPLPISEGDGEQSSHQLTFPTHQLIGPSSSNRHTKNLNHHRTLSFGSVSAQDQSPNNPNATPDIPTKLSYSEVVSGGTHHNPLDEIKPMVLSNLEEPPFDSCDFKPTALYQGKPAVIFPLSEKKLLVEKLKFVLVGKFSHGRPSMLKIREFFAALKLLRSYNISVFDKKHIFIECGCKCDYDRIWLNLVWIIDGFTMRIHKWTADFNPVKESAIVPVWIRLEGLPLYLFDRLSLLSIANSIGKPIRVDPRNVARTIVHSARICVELDISQPLLEEVWVSFEDDITKRGIEGFWAKLYYDVIPPYCSFCSHLGHEAGRCKRRVEEQVRYIDGIVPGPGAKSYQGSHVQAVLLPPIFQQEEGTTDQDSQAVTALGMEERAGFDSRKEQALGRNQQVLVTSCSRKAEQQGAAEGDGLVPSYSRKSEQQAALDRNLQVLVTSCSRKSEQQGAVLDRNRQVGCGFGICEDQKLEKERNKGGKNETICMLEQVSSLLHHPETNESVLQQANNMEARLLEGALPQTSVAKGAGLKGFDNEVQHGMKGLQAQEQVPFVQAATVGTVTTSVDGTSQAANELYENDQVLCEHSRFDAVLEEQNQVSYGQYEAHRLQGQMKVAGVLAKEKAGNSWADLVEKEEQCCEDRVQGLQRVAARQIAAGKTVAAEIAARNTTAREIGADSVLLPNTVEPPCIEEEKQDKDTTQVGADSHETEMVAKEIGGNTNKITPTCAVVLVEEEGGASSCDVLVEKDTDRLSSNGLNVVAAGATTVVIKEEENSLQSEGHLKDTNLQQNYLQSVLQGTVLQDACQFAKSVDLGLNEAKCAGESITEYAGAGNPAVSLSKELQQGNPHECLWPSKQQVEELTERMNRLRGKEPDRREEVVVSGNNSNNQADLALHLQQIGMNSRSVKHVVLQTHTMAADVKEVGSEEQEKREQAALVLLETKGVWSALEETAIDDFQMFMASPKRIGPVFARTICSEVVRNSPKIADVRKHFKFLSNKEQTTSLVEQGKLDDMLKDAMNEYTKEIYQALLEQDKSIYPENSTTEKVTPQTQEAILKVSTMDEKEWSTPKRRGRNRTRTNNI